jgi:dephospho-CoA kinase
MIIGITGIFGTGKTTVSEMFRKYDFKIINVDELYRNIYTKDKLLKNKIKKEFGTLDRDSIKEIVFNDSNQLKKLNHITHPVIIDLIKKQVKKIINDDKDAKIILDAPLLIEANMQGMVGKIIVVKCDEKTRVKRLFKKKRYTKEEIIKITRSQMGLDEKMKYADFVVDNSKTIKETEKQVEKITRLLMTKGVMS